MSRISMRIVRNLACLSSISLLVLCSQNAFAHHPGGAGNANGAGPINTVSASTLRQGGIVAGVVVDNIGLDQLSDATLIEAAEHAEEHGEHHSTVHSLKTIVSPSLNFAYGVTNDLTLALRLPYVVRTDIREGHFHDGEGEVHLHGDATGIGDISALAQWRFVNNRASGTEMALLAGVTAPTGKTNETDKEGETFDAEFQPGTGAWQGQFGLALTQRAGAWAFDASVLYAAVGTGTQNTDLGDRVHYGIAASYRVAGFSSSGPMYAGGHDHSAHTHTETPSGPALDLILELNGEWQDRQIEDGETNGDSGGTVVYIAPGVRLTMDKWSGFASVGIPIVNDLNGQQSEPEWRLVTGVSVGF